MINKEFKLFTNCIPVKGINRGIIIDLQRSAFHILPNTIIDFLGEYSGKKVYNLFQDFKRDKDILKKYMRYFLENELVILTDVSAQFPIIGTDLEKPNIIDTLTINIDLPMQILENLFHTNIEYLGVYCLRLVSENVESQKLIKILQFLEYSKILKIVIYIKYNSVIDLELRRIKSKFSRIEIIFFDYERGGANLTSTLDNFIYEKKSLNEILSMRIQNQNDFVLTMESFNESLKFNTSYNKSLYIDQVGNIKRYIDDDLDFGKIEKEDLKQVILNPKIKEFWRISKDKIKVCKDCEFRYICPDGVIPFKEKQSDSLYVKKKKCDYDPYKNTWNA